MVHVWGGGRGFYIFCTQHVVFDFIFHFYFVLKGGRVSGEGSGIIIMIIKGPTKEPVPGSNSVRIMGAICLMAGS